MIDRVLVPRGTQKNQTGWGISDFSVGLDFSECQFSPADNKGVISPEGLR
jgi:hypothetical protein